MGALLLTTLENEKELQVVQDVVSGVCTRLGLSQLMAP